MSLSRLLLIALLGVLTMSAVPVLVKSTTANEIVIASVRLAIAALAFTPLVLWRGRLTQISLNGLARLALLGLVFALHWYTYFVSIKLATAAIAALAITTYGVQYLILAWWFNGERAGPAEWLAIAICFMGCWLVTPAFSVQDDISLGIAIGLFSALLYAALPLLHQRASSIGTPERTWAQFSIALLCFLPFWQLGNWQDIGQDDLWILVVLGLVCTVIAHGLWIKASTELPAIYSSMIYYLYLPLAMLSSLLVLDEAITTRKLAGAALVIGASASLSLYRYRRQAN